MVTEGGFINVTDAGLTRRDQTKLSWNHEEADTGLILYACVAADRGYERVLVICRDTDVLLILVDFMSVVEVWMIAGIAKKRKSYQVYEVSQWLTQPVSTSYSVSMHWQALTLLQASVVMGRSPAGKHCRTTHFLSGLEMLPRTRDAMGLYAIRVNYQANIWLQAKKEHIDVPPLFATTAWKREAESLWQYSGQDLLYLRGLH